MGFVPYIAEIGKNYNGLPICTVRYLANYLTKSKDNQKIKVVESDHFIFA